jgi:CubicO group peptidase (beta-lactamase class C family)
VVSEASVRAMQQVQFDLPAQPGEGADHWGLGWMLFDWGGRRIIGHDGGTIGQNSSLRVLPEERFAVAVLANGASGVLLAGRIMSWLFGQSLGIDMPERPRPPEPAVEIDLKPYIGVYEQLGLRREVEEHEGRLTMRVVNTGPLADVMPQLPPSDLIAVEPGLFLERSPIGRFVPVTFSGGDDQGRALYLYATRVARRVG